ncbi:mechanosensitive ion channel family protein [Polaribacter sp.]|nr:mechanosensitive ion channel family protein [Polaribacter sp.]
MEVNYKIIYTAVVFVALILLRIILSKSFKKVHDKFGFHNARLVIINKLTNVVLYVTTIVVIAFIWGVEEKQLLIYVSSFLTILGIAFFAQWSILSNVTAGLILFVNYPVKIGNSITIMEKDNDVTGVIEDIGVFFITLKTDEEDFITLPNSIILQKMVRFK